MAYRGIGYLGLAAQPISIVTRSPFRLFWNAWQVLHQSGVGVGRLHFTPCSSACSTRAHPVPPVAPSMSRFMDSLLVFWAALLARTPRVSSHQFTKVWCDVVQEYYCALRNNPTRPYGRFGPRLNLSLNGNQAAQDADCYGFCPASGAELGQNRADVELHGVFRDVELRSHLLISLPKSNQT